MPLGTVYPCVTIKFNPNGALITDLPAQIEQHKGGISVKRLADILGLSRTTLWGMASEGLIPHYKFGRSIRFDPYTTAEWVRSQAMPMAA